MKTRWQPKVDAYDKSLGEAAECAARFVGEIAAEVEAICVPRWLTFSGTQGCGKTMLAKQIFSASVAFNPGAASLWIRGNGPQAESNRRPRCVWFSATEFADAVRADYGLPEYLAKDFLVAIDDVGAAREGTGNMAWLAEALYRLCNARLGRWTLFTTNFSLPEVADRIDPRVASRLIRDGNVFQRITSGDYALRPKAKRV